MRWIYYENCIIPAALQGFTPDAPQGSTGDPHISRIAPPFLPYYIYRSAQIHPAAVHFDIVFCNITPMLHSRPDA